MSVISDLIDEKISVEEAASKALKDGETLAELLEGIVSKQDKTLLNIDQIHQGKQTELVKAYAIEALNDYFYEIADKEKIIDFVKAQLVSASPKTRKSAKDFLEKQAAR
jgi:hypothetical protein